MKYVLIQVNGGVAEELYSSVGVKVIILDWDNLEEGDPESINEALLDIRAFPSDFDNADVLTDLIALAGEQETA